LQRIVEAAGYVWIADRIERREQPLSC
jgi:hypothetical protein